MVLNKKQKIAIALTAFLVIVIAGFRAVGPGWICSFYGFEFLCLVPESIVMRILSNKAHIMALVITLGFLFFALAGKRNR